MINKVRTISTDSHAIYSRATDLHRITIVITTDFSLKRIYGIFPKFIESSF